MFKFVTLALGDNQTPEFDLAPNISFLLRSFGRLSEFFTSSDVVLITRVPSTTQWINPEVVFMAMQLLVQWLGNNGEILRCARSDVPLR